MERLHSSQNLLFIDRALPTALAPNRDLGIQVLGDLHGGLVSYLAGILNGVPDGGSGDLDANDGKDVAARLIVRPFVHRTSSPMRGLGVAFSASSGRQAGASALPVFRTATAQQQFFSYTTGVAADGIRTRYSPQVFYFHGRFGAWAEYVHTRVPVTPGGGVPETIEHRAWQLAGSWMLTRESVSDGGTVVHPRAVFDPPAGRWGAFQIAARIHQLDVDQRAVERGFATDGSSRTAEAATVGLNWYLTPNFRYTVNFERTVFDHRAAGARKPEDAFVFRTQVAF